jgi:ribosome-binding protein aMBF1 (putative translation factor)
VARRDDLDDFVARRSKKNAEFPRLLAEAEKRRKLGCALAKARLAKGLSQEKVAARMATTQSVVSKLESGADVKLSTLLRFAETIGAHVSVETRRRRRRSS